MTDKIHLILMGGTIDSVFDPVKDMVVTNDHSTILSYVDEVVRPHTDFTTQVLTMRDSREITDNTRADLVSAIEKQDCRRILVTHGTYTMPDTAEYLLKHLKLDNRVIVFTGSMYPLKGFAPSDAPFNLGFAVAACQMSDPGIYLAMNSKLFQAGTVAKDTEKGRFELS